MPRGGKGAAKSRRLVDPVPEIDVMALIRYLAKTHRVDADELIEYLGVPEEYNNEVVHINIQSFQSNTLCIHFQPEIDVRALIRYLAKTHRVDADELIEYLGVLEEYNNEVPAVKAKNKGLNTIFGKMAHLRRRFLNLMLDSSEGSPEGEYIEAKLTVFEEEVLIIQNEIRKMGGAFYTLPEVFTRPIALRN